MPKRRVITMPLWLSLVLIDVLLFFIMNIYFIYGIIFVILLALEFVYFKIADHFNIIDKPNERSSHSSVVLRGGGILFAISILVWTGSQMIGDNGFAISDYMPFVIGLILIAGVSFVDDVISLPDSLRLVAQFSAYALMFYALGLFNGLSEFNGLSVEGGVITVLTLIFAFIVCVGATNIYNFMDGINGITAGYSLSVLIPLALLNKGLNGEWVKGLNGEEFNGLSVEWFKGLTGEKFNGLMGEEVNGLSDSTGFVDQSLIIVCIISVIVFSIFNFRPKGKAKCFAGDVGSIGMAFILLFCIGKLVLTTGDITWFVFLLVYGMDGCLTICHRIMLHENLGEAHRKHAFQLMANELKIGHVTVTLIYMAMQLVISLGFIFVCPNTTIAHWCYLVGAGVILGVAYVLFKMKYYHLHEEYLASLKK